MWYEATNNRNYTKLVQLRGLVVHLMNHSVDDPGLVLMHGTDEIKKSKTRLLFVNGETGDFQWNYDLLSQFKYLSTIFI